MPQQLPGSSGNQRPENRRRTGRLRAEGVLTSLGQMIDLSGSGTKIRCGRDFPPEGANVECRIGGPDGDFVLLARVIRARRLGLFVTEIGLEFADVGPAQRHNLNRLAAFLASSSAIVQLRAAA